MAVHEVHGAFLDEVLAVERPTRLTGAGKLVATRDGLRIEASRRAAWTAPTAGCLLPVVVTLIVVALGLALGSGAYWVGRLGGLLTLASIAGGWFLGHAIAPRRAVEVVVPWDEIGQVSGGMGKVYFRVTKGDLRGKTAFTAQSTADPAFAEVLRRMKAQRWDA